MVLIEWREEYCTGIKGVDYEHENLIDQINSVYALVDNRADRQLLVNSLGDIYGSISAHFALEEQTMRKLGYIHLEEHEADHQRLLNEIGDITENLENTDELDESMFKQKLADWFQLHFKTHDSRLHKLVNHSAHDQVDESSLKSLVQKAKTGFLRKIRQRP
jgi:hemerythrin